MKLVKTTALHIHSSDADGTNGRFSVIFPWVASAAQGDQTSQFRFKVLKVLIGYDWPAMTNANNTFTVNNTVYTFIQGSPTVLDLVAQINGFGCGLTAYFEPVSGRFELTNTKTVPLTVETTATTALGFDLTAINPGETYVATNAADVRPAFIVQLRATMGLQGHGYEAVAGQMVQSGVLCVIGMTGPPYSLIEWDLPSSDQSFVEISNTRPRVEFALEDPSGNPIEPNSSVYVYGVIEEWVDDETSIASSVAELTKLKRLGLLAKAEALGI